MNEVITRLNEIEEKAGSILEDARSRKDQMQQQLKADLLEIDREYEEKEEEQLKDLERQLKLNAAKEMEQKKEETDRKKADFLAQFEEKKDTLAEELFLKIIGEA